MKNDWLKGLRENLPEEVMKGANLEMCKIKLKKKLVISKCALGNAVEYLSRLPDLQWGTTVALKHAPDHRASGLASSCIKRLN